jgi:hypothetical protein
MNRLLFRGETETMIYIADIHIYKCFISVSYCTKVFQSVSGETAISVSGETVVKQQMKQLIY